MPPYPASEVRSPEWYERKAKATRLYAESFDDATGKAQMLHIADQYDRLAMLVKLLKNELTLVTGLKDPQ